MMGYPIEEYPDEDTQPTRDINSIYHHLRAKADPGSTNRSLALADSASDEALLATIGHRNGILLWIMAMVALVVAFIYYY
ncbi:hypothetical protein L1987_09181 [Smallanthus sonchifolius]|uniref:Uncharacterized protein n=1 Tax=Smallanthus sonchifolius TaxID=185202 RepID=A0ACB9JN90_9ASTR|nr:hypothetical protein L1987_09181 [Smallanthus sonchifolius]